MARQESDRAAGAAPLPRSASGPDLVQGFRLGDWSVRPLSGSLARDGATVHVEPKVMDVLVRLARAAGGVVTRRELLGAVWPDVVVGEEVITRCVSELRAALGDCARESRYVRTVPKRGYALVPSVSPLAVAEASDSPPENSIAVLPFADASPERNLAWFAEGLADELIDTLGRVPGLRVSARTSSFQFASSRAADARAIGARLGVRHVLEGSVRRGGGRVRVTARLVSCEDGFQLWSETLDRNLDDVLELQAEIARAVAGRLAPASERVAPLFVRGAAKIEAYDWYLRGRHSYLSERPGFHYAGVAELERAIAADPTLAAAHGLHAYIHALRAAVLEPYPCVSEIVRRSYETALALDPAQPEALMAKAVDLRWRTWNWAEVRALFARALEAAPNDPHVLTHFAARFYRDAGELATAASLLRRAIEIDPLNPGPRASLSFVLRFAGDYDGAVEQASHAVHLNPEHGWAVQGAVLALTAAGRYDEAERLLARAERIAGTAHVMTLEARARLEARRGDTARARAALARLAARAREPGGELYADGAGWTSLELGDLEGGVAWLTRALEAGVSGAVSARVCILPIERRRPGLAGAPAFQQLLRRMRLDDASVAELREAGVLEPPSLP